MGIFGDKNYKKLGPGRNRIPSILFKTSIVLVFVFLLTNYVENLGSQEVKKSDLVPIYFVTSMVNKYAKINEENIEEFLIPRQYMPPSLSISRSQIIKSYASRSIAANEIISEYAISDDSIPNNDKGLTDGYRLVFVPVDGMIVSYIKPGAEIDIFCTCSTDSFNSPVTEKIFSSIEVFATPNDEEGFSSVLSDEDQILGGFMGGGTDSISGQQGLILVIPRVGLEKLFLAMASSRIDVALIP